MNEPTDMIPAHLMPAQRPQAQMYPMDALERMAASIIKSRLFGVETMEQAVTLMLVAQSEGMHPAVACRDYHIIQGRPTLKADAMMARFQQSGGKVEWQDYTDLKVAGLFSHPQSPKPVLIEWTMEQAKRIGLASKDNWRKYPRQMLRARVISEGVRTTYPAIATGIYTPEEVQDFEPRGQAAGSVGEITGKQRAIVAETAAQIRAHMKNDQVWDAYQLLESITDSEERMALWAMLDSRIRSSLTAMQEAERAQEGNHISDAQHKRLEARIRELKLNREAVKQYCSDNFNKAHFPDLNLAEYQDVDRYLDAHMPKESAPSPANTGDLPASVASGADPAKRRMTPEQKLARIKHNFDTLGVSLNQLEKHLQKAPETAAGKELQAAYEHFERLAGSPGDDFVANYDAEAAK